MEHRASGLRGAIAIAFLGALVIAALISPVGAALNKNKVKNIAAKTVNNLTYTESEADARFINTGDKASDSELLDGVDSGGFIRPQGLIHVVVGPNEWVVRAGTATVTYLSNQSQFHTAGLQLNQQMGTTPTIPIAMYGRSLELLGFEFCYQVPSGDLLLDRILLNVFSDSTGQEAGEVLQVVDETDRINDTACRLYSLSTPFTLTGNHFVDISARVDYGDAETFFVGRTTLVLAAATTPAAPLARQGAVTMTPTGSDSGTGAA